MPDELARDLAVQFIDIRRDVATGTLGRASPGKFVESVVQVLQALEQGGAYDAQPNVDAYLRSVESRASSLPDGLRICAARLARAMYALRSKRNIVHKAEIDPALYDLQLLYAGAQWVVTELLALSTGVGGAAAARLVAQVQLPAGELVEAIGDRKIVHADLSVTDEALVLLMTWHPGAIPARTLIQSMDRRSAGSVRNAVTALWKDKLLHRTSGGEIVLTEAGLRAAIKIAHTHVA
jgi:hypothetical protein